MWRPTLLHLITDEAFEELAVLLEILGVMSAAETPAADDMISVQMKSPF